MVCLLSGLGAGVITVGYFYITKKRNTFSVFEILVLFISLSFIIGSSVMLANCDEDDERKVCDKRPLYSFLGVGFAGLAAIGVYRVIKSRRENRGNVSTSSDDDYDFVSDGDISGFDGSGFTGIRNHSASPIRISPPLTHPPPSITPSPPWHINDEYSPAYDSHNYTAGDMLYSV